MTSSTSSLPSDLERGTHCDTSSSIKTAPDGTVIIDPTAVQPTIENPYSKEEPNSSEPTILTSFEPGDPENPQNFSLGRKLYHTIVLSMMCFATTMSSSIFTPGFPDIIAKYNVPREVAILTTAIVLVAYAIGPLIWSSVNEAFGRRYAWTISFAGFILFQLCSGIDPNLQTLLIGRFFQGLCGVCTLVTLGASMSDIWKPQQLGLIAPFAISTIFAAPATGPIFGSFLVKWGSFGWLSWLIMILGGILFVLNLFIKETYVPIILKNKAIKMRREGLNVVAPIEATPPTLQNLTRKYILRPFVMLVQDRALLFLSVYSSICYGLLYACLSAFPTIFQHYRQFEFVSSFLPDLSILIGVLVCGTMLALSNKSFLAACQKAGKLVPEKRMESMCIAAVVLPIGLFLLAWTGAFKSVHWIVPCIASVLIAFSTSCVFMVSILYMVNVYKEYAVSALGANAIIRGIIAVLMILTIQVAIERITFQATFSLWGGVALLILPGPFILLKKGEQWRSGSVWGGD
jgi:DHA1 family multidrug resistance protein-like MFS transporter